MTIIHGNVKLLAILLHQQRKFSDNLFRKFSDHLKAIQGLVYARKGTIQQIYNNYSLFLRIVQFEHNTLDRRTWGKQNEHGEIFVTVIIPISRIIFEV